MIFEFTSEGSSRGKIKVIGIGGAGSNAVDGMLVPASAGMTPCLRGDGVELVIMNTDTQSLKQAKTEQKIQLGETVTNGLGTGGNPELGRKAAEESLDLIRDALLGANMVFLTAGLGGGTGTGALPVVAKLAKELGILTVGVVTKPFKFEINRVKIAEQGIKELQDIIDALMVIPNDHLISMVSDKATLTETFQAANEMLYQAVSSISDLINVPGIINVDFASIRSVMGNQGGAVIGIGTATGENRATIAVRNASESGLLETTKVAGAKNILLNISGGPSMTIGEIYQAAGTVAAIAHPQANIIFGAVIDETRNEELKVTMIATGFEPEAVQEVQPIQEVTETQAIINLIDQTIAEAAEEKAIEEPVTETVAPAEEVYATVPIIETVAVAAREKVVESHQEPDSTYKDIPLFAPPVEGKANVPKPEMDSTEIPSFSPTDYEIPAYLRKRHPQRVAV
ncbi:MAG: cell division protein FtsZ [bacterium]|nr:cell division protein FtsZ [bacterium]